MVVDGSKLQIGDVMVRCDVMLVIEYPITLYYIHIGRYSCTRELYLQATPVPSAWATRTRLCSLHWPVRRPVPLPEALATRANATRCPLAQCSPRLAPVVCGCSSAKYK